MKSFKAGVPEKKITASLEITAYCKQLDFYGSKTGMNTLEIL